MQLVEGNKEAYTVMSESRWSKGGNDYATIVAGQDGSKLQPVQIDDKGNLSFLTKAGDILVRVRRKPGNDIKVEFYMLVKVVGNQGEIGLVNKYKEGKWHLPPTPACVPLMKAALKKLDTKDPCFALYDENVGLVVA